MLEIQELSKSYGKHLAVDQVSFFIPDGRWGFFWGRTAQESPRLLRASPGF